MTARTEISGSVQTVLYGPTDDGFTMLTVRDAEGQRHVVSGRAVLGGIQVGDEVEMAGDMRNGSRGPVLNVRTAVKRLPQTESGMTKWLAKAKLPGLGPTYAKRLVDAFGIQTIARIVSEDPEAAAILGKKRLPRIAAALAAKQEESEVGIMLAANDIGAALQRKIFEFYKGDTKRILTTDPYRLIMDLDGVAFTTADKIARSTGLSDEAPSRIKAGIIETLREASMNGDCALYHAQLLEKCRQRLYVTEEAIEDQLEDLKPRRIVETTVRGLRAWALVRLNKAEKEFARHLARKLRDPGVASFGAEAIRAAVSEAARVLDVTLNKEQREGAEMALTYPISILTGGPGTGKTHTLKVVCEAWRQLAAKIRVRVPEQREFSLAAPTGKAAKRITESTGFEAKTLHRLLEYKPEKNGFDRNESNPLETGMISIDEASMPDILIATDLGRAWGQNRVFLIGDTAQLPSVGPGKVLADMLTSGRIPHTRLHQIFRQAAGSAIAMGADEIRHGRMPEMGRPGESDLVFIDINNSDDVAERIVDMYVDNLPKFLAKQGIDPASIQVLCPGKKTSVGTVELNKAIQTRLQARRTPGPVVGLSEKMEGAVGDKVIQLENDYEKAIFNGDTGTIVDIERDGDTVRTHVDFGGMVQTFEGRSIPNLALAYALTIHKSQGSEYQAVIIPVTTSHYTLLRRTLLYTGVTRAKRLCILVGSRRAMQIAINEEDAVSRVTTLVDAILDETEED